ncbi:MAG: 3-hydroxyacyl-ACP dehydratase FabZ family protein [Opitutales bacterium]
MDIQAVIPHRPPFLFVDRVTFCDRDRIVAERTWRAEEDFYRGHYPSNPVTPGVLLCESVFQAAALLIAERIRLDGGSIEASSVPVLARIGVTRFRRMVRPGQTAVMEVVYRETLKGFHFMEGKVLVDGKVAVALDFSLTLVGGSAAS